MIKIKKATDPIKVNSVKLLLYGQPGVRKTSYSFTAPNALLIDCDGGIRRVQPIHRKDYMEVSRWEDVLEIVNSAEQLTDYKTIIVDTVGKCLDYATEYLIRKDPKLGRKDGALSLQGYGALKSEFSRFLTKLSLMGKHIVLVAHDKESKNGDETIIRPDITGSTLGAVIRDMDLVGYCQSYNGRCTVSFTPSDSYYGKNTCGFPDKIDLEKLPLDKAFSDYEIKVNSATENLKEYQEQLKNVETILSNVTNCEELNTATDAIKEIPFVMDGKLQASQMIKEKAAELKCSLNKTTKVYEPSAEKAAV